MRSLVDSNSLEVLIIQHHYLKSPVKFLAGTLALIEFRSSFPLKAVAFRSTLFIAYETQSIASHRRVFATAIQHAVFVAMRTRPRCLPRVLALSVEHVDPAAD